MYSKIFDILRVNFSLLSHGLFSFFFLPFPNFPGFTDFLLFPTKKARFYEFTEINTFIVNRYKSPNSVYRIPSHVL